MMSDAEESAQIRCRTHEGCVLERYKCPTGHWTIGFGHRCSADQPAISRNQAEELFTFDWNAATRAALELCERHDVRLEGERLYVIAEMCFQLGSGGVRRFRKMWKAIRVGDWNRAALEMLDSRWRSQTPARCERLAEVMRTGLDRQIEHSI